METGRWKKHILIRWITAAGIAAAAAAVLIAARCSTAFADWFDFTVYPVFSGIGSRLWGIFPFSAGEIFVILFILSALVGLVFLIVLTARRKGRRLRTLSSGLSWAGIAAAALFFLGRGSTGTITGKRSGESSPGTLSARLTEPPKTLSLTKAEER